jgi:transposase-like protein
VICSKGPVDVEPDQQRRRDAEAAARFSPEVLGATRATPPRVITVDSRPAYPPAFDALQQDGTSLDTGH